MLKVCGNDGRVKEDGEGGIEKEGDGARRLEESHSLGPTVK